MENDSILVPKINVAENDIVQKPAPEKQAKEIINPVKPRKVWVKITLWILLAAAVLLVYNVISGLLIYQKTTKLVNGAKTLSQAAKSQDLA
ncbi:TPA: hypothetical protein DEP81_01270, partial [Candidatus Woesebacteria bacterium]|nr:hypothetical protein [Candidatus Woesebacteria bacterium]